MKKVTLLFATMLIGLTSASASEASITTGKELDMTSRYNYAQPVVFVERGVEFLIFADGSFDFNTDTFRNSTRSNVYYRNRRGINRTFGAPGTVRHHFGGRGVLIKHDYLGRVRRIGNVFINYDARGRIKRAGTVYMRYRRGLLQRVGNLRLQYNRSGRLIGYTGQINFANPNCGIVLGGLDNNNWNDDDVWDNDWDDDDDFYYYRQNGKAKKYKKMKRRYRDDD